MRSSLIQLSWFLEWPEVHYLGLQHAKSRTVQSPTVPGDQLPLHTKHSSMPHKGNHNLQSLFSRVKESIRAQPLRTPDGKAQTSEQIEFYTLEWWNIILGYYIVGGVYVAPTSNVKEKTICIGGSVTSSIPPFMSWSVEPALSWWRMRTR